MSFSVRRMPAVMRFLAGLTLLTFTFNSVSWAEVPLLTSSGKGKGVEFSLPEKIKIPAELGSIQSVFLSPDKSKPLVIYIQDAHAILEAQSHIQKLIAHFQDRYQVRHVLLEGLEGKMDPTLLRTFPDAFIREKVMKQYFERGEMTGAEMAAVLNPAAADYEGLEDWDLYEKNYQAYLGSVESKTANLAQLESQQKALDAEKEKVYSTPQKELHQKLEAFHSDPQYFSELLNSLEKKDLADYPHLKEVFEMVSAEKEMEENQGEVQLRKLAQSFKEKYLKKLPLGQQKEFQAKNQAFQMHQLRPGLFLQYLIQVGEENGFKPKWTPELKAWQQRSQKLAALQGGVFFEELESYLAGLEDSLALTSESKKLLKSYRELRFLKKLVSLELSRKEWENNQKVPGTLRYLVPFGVEGARRFYELAEKRDLAFHQNLDAFLARSRAKVVLVVAGGFHASGFENHFKTSGYSYAVLTPKIESTKGAELYEPLMRGKVSWAGEIQTTLYDAFMRHAAKKLATELNPIESSRQIKFWRDEVIRTLAEQGRLEKTADYTKYTDEFLDSSHGEMRKTEIQKALHEVVQRAKVRTAQALWQQFEAQFFEFSKGLEQLKKSKTLTAENVKLLMGKVSSPQPSVLSPDLMKFNPAGTHSVLLELKQGAPKKKEAEILKVSRSEARDTSLVEQSFKKIEKQKILLTQNVKEDEAVFQQAMPDSGNFVGLLAHEKFSIFSEALSREKKKEDFFQFLYGIQAKEFSYIDRGRQALVFDLGNGLVAKIFFGDDSPAYDLYQKYRDDLSQYPAFLNRPVSVFPVNEGFFVWIEPKINYPTVNSEMIHPVNSEMIHQVETQAAKDGFIIVDHFARNVGITDAGQYVWGDLDGFEESDERAVSAEKERTKNLSARSESRMFSKFEPEWMRIPVGPAWLKRFILNQYSGFMPWMISSGVSPALANELLNQMVREDPFQIAVLKYFQLVPLIDYEALGKKWLIRAQQARAENDIVLEKQAAYFALTLMDPDDSQLKGFSTRFREIYDRARELEYQASPLFQNTALPQRISIDLPLESGYGSAADLILPEQVKTEKVPMVIFLHGLTNKKEQPFLDAFEEALLAKKIAVLRISLPRHREYNDTVFDAHSNPEGFSMKVDDTLGRLFNFLTQENTGIPAVDDSIQKDHLGLFGFSFGGYSALRALSSSSHPHIKALVALNPLLRDRFLYPEPFIISNYDFLKRIFRTDNRDVIKKGIQYLALLEGSHEALLKNMAEDSKIIFGVNDPMVKNDILRLKEKSKNPSWVRPYPMGHYPNPGIPGQKLQIVQETTDHFAKWLQVSQRLIKEENFVGSRSEIRSGEIFPVRDLDKIQALLKTVQSDWRTYLQDSVTFDKEKKALTSRVFISNPMGQTLRKFSLADIYPHYETLHQLLGKKSADWEAPLLKKARDFQELLKESMRSFMEAMKLDISLDDLNVTFEEREDEKGQPLYYLKFSAPELGPPLFAQDFSNAPRETQSAFKAAFENWYPYLYVEKTIDILPHSKEALKAENIAREYERQMVILYEAAWKRIGQISHYIQKQRLKGEKPSAMVVSVSKLFSVVINDLENAVAWESGEIEDSLKDKIEELKVLKAHTLETITLLVSQYEKRDISAARSESRLPDNGKSLPLWKQRQLKREQTAAVVENSEPKSAYDIFEGKFAPPEGVIETLELSRSVVKAMVPQLRLLFSTLQRRNIQARAFGGAVRALAFATQFHYPLPISEIDLGVPVDTMPGPYLNSSKEENLKNAEKDYGLLLHRESAKRQDPLDPLELHYTDEVSLSVILRQREWSISKFWLEFDDQRKIFLLKGDKRWIDDLKNKKLRLYGTEFSDPARVPRMLKLASMLMRYGFTIDTESLNLFEEELLNPKYASGGSYAESGRKARRTLQRLKIKIGNGKSKETIAEDTEKQKLQLREIFKPLDPQSQKRIQGIRERYLVQKKFITQNSFSYEDEGAHFVIYAHPQLSWILKAPKITSFSKRIYEDMDKGFQIGQGVFLPYGLIPYTILKDQKVQIDAFDSDLDQDLEWVLQPQAFPLNSYLLWLKTEWGQAGLEQDVQKQSLVVEDIKLLIQEWRRLTYRAWALGIILEDHTFENVGVTSQGDLLFIGESFDESWTGFFKGNQSMTTLMNNVNQKWLRATFGRILGNDIYKQAAILNESVFDTLWPSDPEKGVEAEAVAQSERKSIPLSSASGIFVEFLDDFNALKNTLPPTSLPSPGDSFSLSAPLRSEIRSQALVNSPRITVMGGADDEGPGKSAYLLEFGGTKILLDAGAGSLESLKKNLSASAKLDAILLSHAHRDHSGDLFDAAFRFKDAPIYTAEGTLATGLLPMLEESIGYTDIEERRRKRKNFEQGKKRLHEVKAGDWFQLNEETKILFKPASHILGAHLIYIATPYGNYLYTGDFSTDKIRGSEPLQLQPDVPVDQLWMEATYGAVPRLQSREERERNFANSLAGVLKNGGKVLIPTFAIGRTTDVVLTIRQHQEAGVIPPARIFIDGMAAYNLEIYLRYLAESSSLEDKKLYDLLDSEKNLIEFVTTEIREDILAGRIQEPFVILGGSGSLKGGRALQYLPVIGKDLKNAIFLVGHQFEGTHGRDLKEGVRELTIQDKKVSIKAKVEVHDFGAHADQKGLVALASEVNPKSIFLIHGDLQAKTTLKGLLEAKGFKVSIPKTGDEIEGLENFQQDGARDLYFDLIQAVPFPGMEPAQEISSVTQKIKKVKETPSPEKKRQGIIDEFTPKILHAFEKGQGIPEGLKAPSESQIRQVLLNFLSQKEVTLNGITFSLQHESSELPKVSSIAQVLQIYMKKTKMGPATTPQQWRAAWKALSQEYQEEALWVKAFARYVGNSDKAEKRYEFFNAPAFTRSQITPAQRAAILGLIPHSLLGGDLENLIWETEREPAVDPGKNKLILKVGTRRNGQLHFWLYRFGETTPIADIPLTVNGNTLQIGHGNMRDFPEKVSHQNSVFLYWLYENVIPFMRAMGFEKVAIWPIRMNYAQLKKIGFEGEENERSLWTLTLDPQEPPVGAGSSDATLRSEIRESQEEALWVKAFDRYVGDSGKEEKRHEFFNPPVNDLSQMSSARRAAILGLIPHALLRQEGVADKDSLIWRMEDDPVFKQDKNKLFLSVSAWRENTLRFRLYRLGDPNEIATIRLEAEGNTLHIKHGKIKGFPEKSLHDSTFKYWVHENLTPFMRAMGFEKATLWPHNIDLGKLKNVGFEEDKTNNRSLWIYRLPPLDSKELAGTTSEASLRSEVRTNEPRFLELREFLDMLMEENILTEKERAIIDFRHRYRADENDEDFKKETGVSHKKAVGEYLKIMKKIREYISGETKGVRLNARGYDKFTRSIKDFGTPKVKKLYGFGVFSTRAVPGPRSHKSPGNRQGARFLRSQRSEMRGVGLSHEEDVWQLARPEKSRLPELLTEKGVDLSKFETLIYPAAGNHDGVLMAQFLNLFPQLQEFQVNSLSFQEDASAGENVRRNLQTEIGRAHPEKSEKITISLNDQDYFSEAMQFDFKFSGPRIWIHKWFGKDDKEGSRPELYTQALLKEHVRPGDLIFVVPSGSNQNNSFKESALVKNTFIPGTEVWRDRPLWNIYQVTQEDVDRAKNINEKKSLLEILLPVNQLLEKPSPDLVRELARSEMRDLEARFDSFEEQASNISVTSQLSAQEEIREIATENFGEWVPYISMTDLSEAVSLVIFGSEGFAASPADLSQIQEFLKDSGAIKRIFGNTDFSKLESVVLDSQLLFSLLDKSDPEHFAEILNATFKDVTILYAKGIAQEKALHAFVALSPGKFKAILYDKSQPIRSVDLDRERGAGTPYLWKDSSTPLDGAAKKRIQDSGFVLNEETIQQLKMFQLSAQEALSLLKLYSIPGFLRNSLPEVEGIPMLTASALISSLQNLILEIRSAQRVQSAA